MEYQLPEPFARTGLGADDAPPRVFGSPLRYVQADGIIDQVGPYLQRLGYTRPAVLLSARSKAAEGGSLLASLERAGLVAETAAFNGECSLAEIRGHVSALTALAPCPDVLVAVGRGKVVDAGRAIAHRLGTPFVAVPSLASNDSPTAAVSVIYTPDGVTESAELYDRNPVLVLLDTGVIASAGERFLVAGMGDALATCYEAQACVQSGRGVTVFGGRPTLAGTALAELAADIIFTYGREAQEAVRAGRVNEALERVVEANTLLSGLGYENGGLAAAHAFAQAYTVIPRVHHRYLHGEMVALGTLTQLVLESRMDAAEKLAQFGSGIGLPVQLAQLGLSRDDDAELTAIVDAALAFPFIGNMPCETSAERLHAALLHADELGCLITDQYGAEAYHRIHPVEA
jgi:glycerol dehydrogenase